MNKLRKIEAKILRHLGEVTGTLIVLALMLGAIIALIKEVQWFIGLVGGV